MEEEPANDAHQEGRQTLDEPLDRGRQTPLLNESSWPVCGVCVCPNGRRATRTVFGVGFRCVASIPFDAPWRHYRSSRLLFSVGRLVRDFARTPPPNVKMPTLHGVGAARNARSSEETDAFTTRNLAQAFLSTPPSRTPSPHDFMERGDNASLTPKPPRTIVGGPTNTPLINAHVTDDASTNANASGGSGRPPSDTFISTSFMTTPPAHLVPASHGGRRDDS